MNYRFTATLKQKYGARIFKGRCLECRDMSDALIVIREIFNEYQAMNPDVTSVKISISPTAVKKS